MKNIKSNPSSAAQKEALKKARQAQKQARKEKVDAKLNAFKTRMQPLTNGFKNLTSATKSGSKKIQSFIRPIERLANSYARILRGLARFIFWFAVISYLHTIYPDVFENIPAIDGLLDSAEIFVDYSANFLRWNFDILKKFVDYLTENWHNFF